jgi:RimJ/RimL family protein N-acetyltransferase/precorrin-3B methylase
MTLGAHITPLSRSYIENADIVFAATSDGVVELWLAKMNRDVRSLQAFYSEGKSRAESYRQMVAAMLAEVRAGKQVCGAFYGHPGVFAGVPHEAIEQARAEGYDAHMEPGISAEDCLYADLGIDPGRYGCQHYEASQLMFYRRRIDPSGYLVLWQVGVAGDRSLARFATGAEYRKVLVDVLTRDYPPEHEAIIYKVATLPTQRPRIERTTIAQLPGAQIDMHATVVIPPAVALQPDQAIRARLAALDGKTDALHPAGLAGQEFSSERLILRPLQECDEQLYCQLFCDPEMMRYIGPAWTRTEAARAFRSALKGMRSTPPRGLYLVVTLKSGERPAGLCSLQNFEPGERRAELGLMLAPSARAFGVATEALIAVLAHAFATLPFDEIWVRFANDHQAATSTAVGSGLVRHAHSRPEDVASNLWRWSAYRDSWRPAARLRTISADCAAADE